jgi:hypothetical protein
MTGRDDGGGDPRVRLPRLVGAGLLGATLILACADPMCGCPPVDTSALAYVQGTVVDSVSAPVVGATVAPTGAVDFDCSFDNYTAYSESVALTDSMGTFEQLVSVFAGPGNHCVEFIFRDSAGGWADTIFSAAVRFRHNSEPPDTVPLLLVISGRGG